ncbi:MAG: FtsX-like permease family protein [Oscillospiraceae bacterium]|nr:FtsX-like permease family protein [Oscillospiraceae bacterium]
MKKNMMRKNLRQSILKSMGRYLAIVAIIALGSAMFVGLRATKTDMVATGQKFTDDQNMFDFRLLNTYGWEKEDVDKIAALDGVVDAESVVSLDVIVQMGEVEGAETVYRFYNLSETVNQVDLRGGRMPERADECLVDGFRYDDSILGTRITLSGENEADTLDSMAYRTYTVVGYVATPLYMDMNRGNTSVGSGTLTSYIYIPMEGFDVDYYTEIDITIPGDYAIYTDAYEDALDAAADELEPQVQQLADDRFAEMLAEAESEYADGYAEYADGLKEFEGGIAQANQELADAYQKLTDAEQTLQENEWLLYDGQTQIGEAKETLNQSAADLEAGKVELEKQKADTYAQLDAAQAELEANSVTVASNLEQVNAGLAAIASLNDGITQLEGAVAQMDEAIAQLETVQIQVAAGIQTAQTGLEQAMLAPEPDQELIAQLEGQLAQLQTQQEELSTQLQQLQAQRDGYEQQLEPLYAQKEQLEPQLSELLIAKTELEEARAAIESGFEELAANRMLADKQFAAAAQEIAEGEAQLEEGWAQIAEKEQEIANGWAQIADGRQEIADGWAEYEDGVKEVEEAYEEGKAELDDAAAELAEARADIDALEAPSVYVLDRYTNVGFASLDSNSDIVAGVSKVFPVFFLLIAALVCITTMTRMVNEERTQIGTLKALGYSNNAIIGKYLAYAGSGAVVGCGLGVTLGSIIFPKILWAAYCIMLYITPDVVIQFDLPLCIGVVLIYTVVVLLVTWYCCRRALDEVPAELIRPKAPTSGKKIFLEHFRFWDKISFLNKVTIRNIFRYRQRLAMMLVGIGGCTALLVTGFGVRDSIVNIVDYQFEEVTVYDLEVYFTEGQTAQEQEKFLSKVSGAAQDVMFFHQTSVELDFDNQVREIYLIAGGDRIEDFIDLHSGDIPLDMPGKNETVLSVGVAEAMGVETGDRVVLRDSEMRELDLTVSAIYDNNVYNYAIVRPETIEAQWGQLPEEQMAFVKVNEEQNVHETGALIAGLNDVMNVSVSDDTASLVGSMMDALDLVVVTIVICAGLLAVIVLYNLTNININERIREIATIKVLGFNASETAAYVFKENLALTVMGSVLGLFFGKLLLEFVMSQIKVDFCWFQARVTPVSYLFAIVLTMLSALLVDMIFHFKLDRINMAEALKSVE